MMAEAQEVFLERCISRCQKDTDLYGTTIFPQRGELTYHSIMVWNPIKSFGIDLYCPIHLSAFEDMNRYQGCRQKGKKPRILFDILRVCLLVSAKYKCANCDNPYLAHDEPILQQIRGKEIPFLLYHRNGITKSAFNFISSSIETGNHIKLYIKLKCRWEIFASFSKSSQNHI